MKTNQLITTSVLLVNLASLNAQNVYIPDPNFKAYLVGNGGINTNDDSEIQVSEAATYSSALYVSDNDISDLQGIEAFTAITKLYCESNSLTSLDVTANTALTRLYCGNNLLPSLDVSANTVLTHLRCSSNQLSSLNIQNGNNANFSYFTATYNPVLVCVQVDDAAFMNSNWLSAIDAAASYSIACIPDNISNALSTEIIAFPNPTTGIIHLSDFCNVMLTDITGKLILEKIHVNTLDISGEPSGMYSLLLSDSNGKYIQRMKVVKE